jgi:hypothetical protein
LFGGKWDGIQDVKEYAQMFWDLLGAFPESGMGWAHDPLLNKYYRKMVLHLDSTLNFPRHHGMGEKTTDAIQAERKGQILNVDASGAVQAANKKRKRGSDVPVRQDDGKLHSALETLLSTAKSCLPESLQPYTEHVWDMTVNFSTCMTPDHVDEYHHDGPGHVILNLCLASDGYVIFTDADPKVLPSDAADLQPFCGLYFPSGSWLGFTDYMRYGHTHQILRMEPEATPMLLPTPGSRPGKNVRIVVTFRFGKCPRKWTDLWDTYYEAEYAVHLHHIYRRNKY